MLQTPAIFAQMPLEAKVNYLKQNATETISSITKDIGTITNPEAITLYDLHQLDKEATVVAKQFVKDLQLSKQYLLNQFEQKLSSETSQDQLKTTAILNDTIITNINEVSSDLKDALKANKTVLFNGLLAKAATKLLGSVLDFEQKIDKLLFLGMSQKIIKSSCDILVGLISINCPVIGCVLKAAKISERISDFFSCNKLKKTVASLQETIHQLEQDRSLRTIYDTSKKIYELSIVAEISNKAATRLNLNYDSLNEITQLITQDPKAKECLQNIAIIADTMPFTKMEAIEFLNPVTQKLHNIVEQYQDKLPKNVLHSIHNKIDATIQTTIDAIGANINQTTGFFQTVANQQDSIIKIISLNKELRSDCNNTLAGRALSMAITKEMIGFFKDVLLFSPEKLIQQIKESSLTKLLGLDFKTEVILDKHALHKSNTLLNR